MTNDTSTDEDKEAVALMLIECAVELAQAHPTDVDLLAWCNKLIDSIGEKK